MASSGQPPDKPTFNTDHLGSSTDQSQCTDTLHTQVVKLSKDVDLSTAQFEPSDSIQTHSFLFIYICLVEAGLLPKLENHEHIVQLANIEGSDEDCKILIVTQK